MLESVRTELHTGAKAMCPDGTTRPEIIERLRTVFELDLWQVFPVNGPVNLLRLFNVYEQVNRPDLKYRASPPRTASHLEVEDLFEELRLTRLLLHHPFDSYDAVVLFIESAAEDDNVLIKQTLYRTSEHSVRWLLWKPRPARKRRSLS